MKQHGGADPNRQALHRDNDRLIEVHQPLDKRERGFAPLWPGEEVSNVVACAKSVSKAMQEGQRGLYRQTLLPLRLQLWRGT